MQSFGDFLQQNEGVPEYRVEYYLRWITEYRTWCAKTEPAGDAVAGFLSHLGTERQDWQVRQARRSLQLFAYYKARSAARPAEQYEAGRGSGRRSSLRCCGRPLGLV